MTEQDWLTATSPTSMLNWARDETLRHPPGWRSISERKLRLFACACSRTFYPGSFNDPGEVDFVPSIERAEAAADGGMPPPVSGEWIHSERDAAFAAQFSIEALHRGGGDLLAAATLLREVIGNPFPPLPGECAIPGWYACERCNWVGIIGKGPTRCPQCYTNHVRKWRDLDRWLAWSDGTVPRLARQIYDARDWDRLPILADALEESGCPDGDLLRHFRHQERCPECRGTGISPPPGSARADVARLRLPNYYYCPACCGGLFRRGSGWITLRGSHCRGCWALDCLLGLSGTAEKI